MEEIGRIERKDEGKAKTGVKYITYTLNGKKYNTFDENLMGFNVGDFVKATLEANGKYTNLVNLESIEEKPVKTEKVSENGSKSEFHLSPEQVRTNALAAALEATSLDKKLEFSWAVVKEFEDYIKNGRK